MTKKNLLLDTPVWLKLQNNNIVLAARGNNDQGVTGWWKVIYEESDHEEGYGEWIISGNEGYITKNAVWQSCPLFL